MSDPDIEALQDWIGKTETRRDVIGAAPVAGLSACLGHGRSRAAASEVLPPCWHWLYFLDSVPASCLGPDGHPARGDFMPPVTLPRRMWAGSRIKFHSPLKMGDEASRESTVSDIQHKQGRSGELVFLTLHHEIYSQNTLCLEEEQDLVYRGPGPGATSTPETPAEPQWTRKITPDPVLLFRYSALTFNSHRIHYDRDYATAEEGYGSLVVQGPLTATLLLDLLHRKLPQADVANFEFRALAPLLEGVELRLQGRRDGADVNLWALDNCGAVAMTARAELR